MAVINATTRERFFGGRPAVGQTIEADGQRFRVVGVVEDVSELRTVPFADIWVPYTTAKTDAYKREIMGGLNAMALAKDKAALAAASTTSSTRGCCASSCPIRRSFKAIVAPFETKFEAFARMHADRRPQGSREPGLEARRRCWRRSALLFVLIPTVNLVNINISRIMERASEIGVRKAFGAPARTLVGQFLVENILLTLVGGAARLRRCRSSCCARDQRRAACSHTRSFTLNPRVFALRHG